MTARQKEVASAPLLRRVGAMKGGALAAIDGDIGSVEDLYFDDQSWTVRWLIVDTGQWLSGRRVLISPRSVSGTDPSGQRFLTALTRAAVEGSPHIDAVRPVSRQHEIEFSGYYGLPDYWGGPYRWGVAPLPTPGSVPSGAEGYTASQRIVERRLEGDPHLRSAAEVVGYGIHASDGDLGHVEDFLVDEESWALRYVIVDPRNWWPGNHVLIGTDWLRSVSWEMQTVSVDLTREAVRNAPVWRPELRVDRAWETELYGYYGRPRYWERPDDRFLLWPRAA